MSDIGLSLSWPVVVLALFAQGWPGLLLGALAGALAWRSHRLLGAVFAGLAGDAIWLLAASG